jgi:predicted RND superfamily exporter protein
MTEKTKKKNERFHPISKWVIRNAYQVAIGGLLLAVLGAWFSALLYQNLRTDIEELLPHTARSGKDLNTLTSRMESIDSLALVIFTKDSQSGQKVVDALAARLQQIPRNIAALVEYRVADEMAFFKKRAGLFLSVEDLEKVKNYIRDRIKYDKEMYSPFNIFPVSDRLKKPELDFKAIQSKYKRNGAYDTFPNGYYSNPEGTQRIILVYMAGKHSDTHTAQLLRAEVDKAIKEVNPQSISPGTEIHFTGGVQNFLEEQAALIADLELSTFIVTVLVTLVMYLFYRDSVGTFAILASLFAGTFWTFGVSYFAVGYLNANSAFLGSIVIGNGINFGIIFLARYIEERRQHRSKFRAVDTAMTYTAKATITAALAAGLSYGSLVLTRFRGFQQFGVIGLIGMVLCWISAFTMLPALLVIFDRKGIRGPKGYKPAFTFGANQIATFVSAKSKPIFLASLLVTLAALATFPTYSRDIIETNLGKLRSKESMEKGSGYYDKYLMEIFQHYLTPIVILANSREDANKIAALVRDKKEKDGPNSPVASVQTFDDFLPQNQEAKITVLKEIKKLLTPKILDNMDKEDQQLARDFLHDESFTPFVEAQIPQLIVTKFSEKDGSVGKMVYVEPPLTGNSEVAWNGRALIDFIHELRRISDSVAPGTPVAGQLPISADLVESISQDGPRATMFAFLAVIFLVVVLFRHVKTIALVLFALLIGVIWLAGVILGLKLKINFLNFIALPITFGIGVDYGVNVFQRYRQEGAENIIQVIRQTGGAVILASLTTIIGYSSLVIASNQAFVSFGNLAVFGEMTCLAAAVVSLPAYLVYRARREA